MKLSALCVAILMAAGAIFAQAPAQTPADRATTMSDKQDNANSQASDTDTSEDDSAQYSTGWTNAAGSEATAYVAASAQQSSASGNSASPAVESNDDAAQLPSGNIAMAAGTGVAPSTGQWDIVATKESNSNTVDGGALQFTTDWTATTSGTTTTLAPLLTATFTNSTCSASGQPVSFTASYSSKTKETTMVITLDNGQAVTLTSAATGTASQFTGTFKSSGGGCMQADSGNFTATLYSALQGSFSGTIESYAQTNTVNVTISLATSASFAVTGSVQSSSKACMANLTINGTAAQAYGPSIATGDALYFNASDNSGDVVNFVASATDANGKMLSPAWPSQVYVTYFVVAGPCSGDGGTDAPFQQQVVPVTAPPVRPRAFGPRFAMAQAGYQPK